MELMALVGINDNEREGTSLFTTSTIVYNETNITSTPLGNTSVPGNETDIPYVWIRAAQGWALILSVFGSTGNVLAIATILWQICLQRNRHAQHLTGSSELLRPVVPFDGYTLLLLNLSICDLLYCSVNLPLTFHTYNYAFANDTDPTDHFCTGAALFRYLNALVEWMTLALITIQRCVDLRRSKGMRFFKPKPTIIFIIIIWTISSLPQLLLLIPNFGGYYYDSSAYKCDIVNETARFIFFTMESSLPCLLMPVGCFGIIYQIWRNVKDLRESGASEALVKERFREMYKYVTLTLTLLLLFLVCVVPICVFNVMSVEKDISGHGSIPLEVGIGIYMVYWILYGVNFLLYVARNDNFRKAFRNLLLYIATKVKGDTDLPRILVSSIQTMDKGDFDSVSQISVTSHHLRMEVSGTILSSHSSVGSGLTDLSSSTKSTHVSNS